MHINGLAWSPETAEMNLGEFSLSLPVRELVSAAVRPQRPLSEPSKLEQLLCQFCLVWLVF